MAIVSSVITQTIDLGGGLKQVHEAHTDNVGIVHTRSYICSDDIDPTTQLAVNADMIAESLAATEIDGVLSGN